jgi:hypothetical protein
MASATGKNHYRPGERAPAPGIYRVLHTAHRQNHENSFRRGQVFPACKQCGKAVRFELLEIAEKAKRSKRS